MNAPPFPSRVGSRVGLALVVCAALLQACALSPAPVDSYYRLSADKVDFRFATPRLAGALKVRRPRADALTDGTHLLYRRAENPTQIYLEPYQLWTDSPTLLLRDLLLSVLRSANLAELVLPPSLGIPAEFNLVTRLARLERLVEAGSQRVRVEIEFSLVRERDRSLLFHETYSDSASIEGSGTPEVVAAYDLALSHILQRFLTELDRRLPSDVAGIAARRR